MSSERGSGDDAEMARLLKGALRQEADRVPILERYDAVRTAAEETERRRPTWLFAVAAVVVLVLGAGVIWQSGLSRGNASSAAAPAASRADAGGQDKVQASQAAPAPAPATPAPTSPAASGSQAQPTGTAPPTRSVTGTSVAFASATGNIVCLMSGREVACQLMAISAWEQAAPRACPVVGGGTMTFAYNQGAVSLTATGASLSCGGQALVAADLGKRDRATSWYQAGRDTTVKVRFGEVPVLPYGGVATTTGGQTCAMTQAGVACSDPSGAAISLSREQLSMAGPTAATRVVTRFVTVAQLSAFATPSGGIVCTVNPDAASCEVRQPTYTPPAKPASCQLEWAGRIAVDNSTRGFLCVGDSMVDLPSIGGSWTTWYDPGFGSTIRLPSGNQGAVLDYGSTISAGSYTCKVEQAGVTCTDTSGRGFQIAKGSYRYLP